MSLLIKLEKVTKVYQVGHTAIHALREIDFELNHGEMAAIVGVSGSGKSTLMNIMGCLDRCTSGHYFFAGRDVSQLSYAALAAIRNKSMGFVFQSFFLLPRLNALHNVMLPLFYRDMPRKQAQSLAMDMLEKVGVAHLANHKPQQLSGGQQQRIAIARALVGEPDVIFADEPTGALDSQTGNDIMALFVQLNREGRTIIIITHDKEISQRCQRMVTVKDGKCL